MQAWQTLGGTAERTTFQMAADAVAKFAHGKGSVLGASDVLNGLKVDLLWPDCGLEAAESAGVGVVRAKAAAAQTGSVFISSDINHGRAVSLLPTVCVFIIRESDIHDDIGHYLRTQSALPSSLVAVTGPSRSADIESTLVIGVHGPGRVHALLLK